MLVFLFLDSLQISYASSSALLDPHSKYPNVFRTIPDNTKVTPALATFIEFFNWRQVMVITQQISATEKVVLYIILKLIEEDTL